MNSTETLRRADAIRRLRIEYLEDRRLLAALTGAQRDHIDRAIAEPLTEPQQRLVAATTPGPDLATVSLDADALGDDELIAGELLPIEFEFANVGDELVAVDAYDVGFYLSTNEIIDTSDFLIAFIDGDEAPAGAALQGSVDALLPTSDSPFWVGDGTYFVGMVLDDLFQLAEADEGNNFSATLGVDIDDINVTIPPPPPPPPLPVDLFDIDGFRWDIQLDGSISNGTIDAYDGGHDLTGFLPTSSSSITFEEDGREVVIGPEPQGDVEVTRKIYVPTDGAFARFLEIVTNSSSQTVTHTIEVATNLGSDSSTALVSTQDGLDQTFTTADDWIVTDDADGGGDPTVLHVISGFGGVDPVGVSTNAPGDDDIAYTYELTLAPGETQIVMHFGAQSNSRAEAIAKGGALRRPDAVALAGLSDQELSQIVNFTFDPLPQFPFENPERPVVNQFGDARLFRSLSTTDEADTFLIDAFDFGQLVVSTEGDVDTVIGFYDGSDDAPTLIDGDSGSAENGSITVSVNGQAELGVAVVGDSGATGGYTLVIDGPQPEVEQIAVFDITNRGDATAAISNGERGDWYEFHAGQSGEWVIEYDGNPLVDVLVFDSTGQLVTDDNDTSFSSLSVFPNDTENYALLVRSRGETGSYNLRIEGPSRLPEFPFDDPTELVTNQFGQATLTTPDGNFDLVPDDYIIAPGASGSVFVNATNEVALIGYYNGDGPPIETDLDPSGSFATVGDFYDGSGPIGLSVVSLGGYGLEVSAPSVFTDFIDIDQTFHQGHRFSQAIDAEFDNDWFEFSPDREGEWTITITPFGGFDPTLAVFDNSGDALFESATGGRHQPIDEGGGGEAETFAIDVGLFDTFTNYAFRVDGYSNSTGGYEVLVQGPIFPDSVDFSSDAGVLTADPFGDIETVSGSATNGGVDYYYVRTPTSGQVQIEASGFGDIALALYTSESDPPVMVSEISEFPALDFSVGSGGDVALVGVVSNDSYTLNGMLPEAFGEIEELFIQEFNGDFPFHDANEFVSIDGGYDVRWLSFEALIDGEWEVSDDDGGVTFTVFDEDGLEIGSEGTDAPTLDFGDIAYVRVELDDASDRFDSARVEIIGPQGVGSVVLDVLTAPFVILDRFASNISFDIDWESLNGIADSFEVALVRQFPDGSLDQETLVDEFFSSDIGSEPSPSQVATDTGQVADAVDFYQQGDASVRDGETAYRVRLRAFDGDGIPSIEAIEIDNFTVTSATTFVQGNYNRDGIVSAADYTAWRDTTPSAVGGAADGNGDRVVDSRDYEIWRGGFGQEARDAVWDFEDNTSLPDGWVVDGRPDDLPGITNNGFDFGKWEIGTSSTGVGDGGVLRMFHFTPLDAGSAAVAALVVDPRHGQEPQPQSSLASREGELLSESVAREEALSLLYTLGGELRGGVDEEAAANDAPRAQEEVFAAAEPTLRLPVGVDFNED